MSSERAPVAAGRLTTFMMALLAATALTAAPAWADGGAGGSGAAGGIDQASGTGGAGTSDPGGGGGGGGTGQVGGAGGSGTTPGGLGGLAPGNPSLSGQAGTAGGGGGGGGAHFQVLTTSGALTTGVGGAGGAGGGGGFGNGGGGAAGWGAAITGGGSFTNGVSVSGGAGGGSAGAGSGGSGGRGVGVSSSSAVSLSNSGAIAGGVGGTVTGAGDGRGGDGGFGVGVLGSTSGNTFINGPGATVTGGDGGASGSGLSTLGSSGGHGVFIEGANATVFNDVGATIAGGNGGASAGGGIGGLGVAFAGSGTVTNLGTIRAGDSGPGGTFQVNGIAIAGIGNTTIINSGSIIGGIQFDGVRQIAIVFSAGTTNVLELRSGSTIVGHVLSAATASSSLRLGGTTDSSFDVSQVGPLVLDPTTGAQYQGFSLFEKTGSSTWTLTGTTTETTSWSVSGGALSISSDANLGAAASTIGLAGGALRTTASFTTSRTTTLGVGGGTFDTATGTTLTHNGTIGGVGGLTKTGDGTLALRGANNYAGGTTVTGGLINFAVANNFGIGPITLNGGGLQWATGTTADISAQGITLGAAGGTFDTNGNTVTLASAIGGGGALAVTGTSTLLLSGTNTYGGATTIGAGGTLSLSGGGSIATSSGVNLTGALATFDISLGAGDKAIQDLAGVAGSSVLLGNNSLTVGSATATTFAGVIDGSGGTGGIVKTGTGTLTLSGTNTYTGGTTINGGTLSIVADSGLGGAAGALALNGGTLQITGANVNSVRGVTLGAGGGTFDIAQNANLLGNIGGTGGLTKNGPGTLALGGANSYGGGTTINAGLLELLPGASLGPGALAINGGSFNNGGNNVSVSGVSGSGGIVLNGGSLTANSAASSTFSGVISGSGALVKQGTGTLTLSGNNLYSGGTTVSGGILAGTTASLQGNILNNATVSFNQAANGTYAGAMSGTGGVTMQGGGVLSITGTNLYTGPTTVTGSGLVVNGSLASTVMLDSASAIGGTGSIGGLVSNGATLAPGNSIGTLTVNGNFSQTGGTYVVEANPQGQSDRVNVTGTATINGATVQLVAAPGSYGTSTTYTILNAAGGVTGTYTGVTSNFAFLTSSLTYNANNVFLTLALQGNAFSGFGGNTVNQRAVGLALDQSYANASGDFATVIGALAGLNIQQGPYALNQISGQPYADFGTVNLASNTLFMNAVGQQMAVARGGAGSGQRQALAQACDIAACDSASPFSMWASGLGGFGSVQGDGNSQTLTYNLGGAAAGIDYRVSPSFLLGLGAGYTSGTQWVDTFSGKGWTNAVSVAAYGSFTTAGFYADLLAGYAWSSNQLQRQITVPGLQPRTANGSTGANQFLGQAEIGYQVPVYAPAQATVTPFARLQVMSVNQAAFNEWGANSLSLNVQQQTTNSVRSTLGAQLNGSIGLGETRTLDMALRLGWLHEYAYTGRPVTAAFAGAPASAFTVYGATPQRDAAAIGFQASTNVATATQIYFRYDGDIGSGTDNHALNLGLRLSW